VLPTDAVAGAVGTTLKVVEAPWAVFFLFLVCRDTLCGKSASRAWVCAGDGGGLTSLMITPSSMRLEYYATFFREATRVRWCVFGALAHIARARRGESRDFMVL
jgi:hypothetical protein